MIISSCSLIDQKNIAPGYFEAYRTLNELLFESKENFFTPAMVRDIPYASSLLKIGRGDPGLIILESLSGDSEFWVSSDGVFLEIRGGKIIQTRGLHNNLVGYRVSSNSKEENHLNPGISKAYYSYDNPSLVNMEVVVKVNRVRQEKLELFDQILELVLYEEEISNEYIGWKVTNRYWIDEEKFVWKSIQYISPKLPKFQIEVTKKPAK